MYCLGVIGVGLLQLSKEEVLNVFLQLMVHTRWTLLKLTADRELCGRVGYSMSVEPKPND
jgi:hypothetical protein